MKKMLLKIYQKSLGNTCAGVSLLINLNTGTWNFIQIETQAQVFFCEFYEIFKSAYFVGHLRITASELLVLKRYLSDNPERGILRENSIFNIKLTLSIFLKYDLLF